MAPREPTLMNSNTVSVSSDFKWYFSILMLFKYLHEDNNFSNAQP